MGDILTVVPARGGSKGLPGKNIRPLAGLPLIGHVLRTARTVDRIGEIVLSTDDDRTADVGRGLGFLVPFLRPGELATDAASSSAVVLHALSYMEQQRGRPYKAVLLLQPTCPFTSAAHINRALDLMHDLDLDFVGSVIRIVDEHPAYMLQRLEDGHFARAFPQFDTTAPRQLLPPFYVRSGNVYLSRRDTLAGGGQMIAGATSYVEVDRADAININDAFDWMVAESHARYQSTSPA